MVSSSILNSDSCTFGNKREDRAGRIPPPGKFCLQGWRQSYAVCYTGSRCSRLKRTPIPDAGLIRLPDPRASYAWRVYSELFNQRPSVAPGWSFSPAWFCAPPPGPSPVSPHGVAVVDDPVDHSIVILQNYLGGAQRGFRLHGDGHAVPIDAGEQLRPLELFGALRDHVQGRNGKNLRHQL